MRRKALTLKTPILPALLLCVALAACDSAEERAETHFENALALIEEGDVARARVELRNVFELVPDHPQAREAFARLLLDEGETAGAFGQYMRIIEANPNSLEARLVVGRLLMQDNAFDQAKPHLDAALEIAPDDAEVRVLANTAAYRDAVVAEDAAAQARAATEARVLAEILPDSVLNNSVLTDSMMLQEDFSTVLVELERIQQANPDERRFYQMRLTANARTGDMAGVESTLQEMIARFPEDEALPQTLMRFYASQGDPDGAEEFLRSRVIEGEQNDAARVALVQFLVQVRGAEAALSELDALIDEGTNSEYFRALQAILLYDTGERERALDIFAGVTERAEPSPKLNDIRTSYASVLLRDGNEVGARALVEEVLAEDPAHVGALLMRAAWQIQDDDATEAIVTLRTAQDQDPENPAIFTRLAEAYARNGERDLAGEMLALAFETSNSAPREAIVYARFLVADGRLKPAEAVLIDALRLAPRTLDLLSELAAIYVRLEDWGRAGDIEAELREIGSPQAISLANGVELAVLQGRGESDAAIARLEDLNAEGAGGIGAEIAIAQTLARNGDPAAAVAHLQGVLEENPDNATLRFVLGNAHAAAGDLDAAIAEYRTLVEQGISAEELWVALVRALRRTGQTEEASAVLQTSIAALPDAPNLNWILASELERAGDVEGAIAIYEKLYDANSASPIVANNLASLLSTVRQDADSLDRAERISRRLRETDVPAFQDTYGWIQYLQGNYSEALDYLAPAAEALPEDPMVQVHYGLALAAAERTEEAIAQLANALEAAPDDTRPAFVMARERLAELQNGDTVE